MLIQPPGGQRTEHLAVTKSVPISIDYQSVQAQSIKRTFHLRFSGANSTAKIPGKSARSQGKSQQLHPGN
jgi:hypothetical protein